MIKIKIDTSNSAFENFNEEVIRILKNLCNKLKNENVTNKCKLIDINGNVVGKFERIEE